MYRASGVTLRALRVAQDFPPKIFPKETHILHIPSKPYSIHSTHSAIGKRINFENGIGKKTKQLLCILSIPIPGQFPASYITLG